MFASSTKIPLLALLVAAVGLVHCGDDKSLVVGEERGGSDESGGASGASGSAGAPSGGSGSSPNGGSGASPNGGSGASPNGGSGASPSGGSGGVPSGGSGGTSGSGTGGRPSGGGGPGSGPRPPSCEQMAEDYRQFLMGAQICNPDRDPCSLIMPDDLLCGCPTYVNPYRRQDVDTMNYIIALAADCPRSCPPIGCRPTSGGGVCMAEPNQNPPRPHCFVAQ